MPNRNYNASGAPGFSAVGASVAIRQEFEAIAAGIGGLEQEIDDKVFAASAPSEWVNPARVETYVSATQFKWAGADATGIMVEHRRVRCTVNGVYVYSEVMSSAYAGGFTTVNLLDPILTADLTLVEYATTSPYDSAASSMSLSHLQAIIDGRATSPAEVSEQIEAEVPALVIDQKYTDIGGSGEKCKLGVRYLGTDDFGAKMFAIEPIPV